MRSNSEKNFSFKWQPHSQQASAAGGTNSCLRSYSQFVESTSSNCTASLVPAFFVGSSLQLIPTKAHVCDITHCHHYSLQVQNSVTCYNLYMHTKALSFTCEHFIGLGQHVPAHTYQLMYMHMMSVTVVAASGRQSIHDYTIKVNERQPRLCNHSTIPECSIF